MKGKEGVHIFNITKIKLPKGKQMCFLSRSGYSSLSFVDEQGEKEKRHEPGDQCWVFFFVAFFCFVMRGRKGKEEKKGTIGWHVKRLRTAAPTEKEGGQRKWPLSRWKGPLVAIRWPTPGIGNPPGGYRGGGGGGRERLALSHLETKSDAVTAVRKKEGGRERIHPLAPAIGKKREGKRKWPQCLLAEEPGGGEMAPPRH